jgi:hypothetical protein
MLDQTTRPGSATVLVPTTWGALLDRIEILKLKRARAGDPTVAFEVARELDLLCDIRDRNMRRSAAIDRLVAELAEANAEIWEAEDAIRRHGRHRDFGHAFVAAARSIYQANDRRSGIKQAIDDALGSAFRDHKIYATD